MEISGHTFVVTGAASGLGAATSAALVEQGGQVLIADTNEIAGQQLAASLGEAACFVHVDVTDEASAKRAYETAMRRFGRLRGLINCAGIAPAEKILGKAGAHRLDTFSKVVQVNLVGTFNMMRVAAQHLAQEEPNGEGERGVVINTASIAAFEGQIGQAAYAASKAAVVGMTLPVARELSRYGIRVVTIAPGLMETPMLLGMPEDVQASLAASVPFPPRLGKPHDFAALVIHIVRNSYLNGEVIRLDGALRMAAR